ncbi:MAG: hypothetical protein ACP5Q5_00695 [Brevinematia bacterium]
MFIILLFLPCLFFAEVKPVIIVDDFIESTNSYISQTHNLILENLKGYDISNFVIQPFVYKVEKNIYLKAKIYTNKSFIKEEEVYVKLPISEEKWIVAVKDLILRLTNETNTPYISKEDKELKEKINSFSEEELINLIKELSKNKSLQLVSIFNFGYSFPMNIEISFISLFKTWSFSDFLSFGFGTKVLKVYPLLPYETNSAITILPVEIYFPLFIDQKSKYNDIIFNFEWGWYKNNTTNTIKYNEDLTYIDLSIKYLLPYTILKAGINYNYLRDKVLFYAGVDIYIGRYGKE